MIILRSPRCLCALAEPKSLPCRRSTACRKMGMTNRTVNARLGNAGWPTMPSGWRLMASPYWAMTSPATSPFARWCCSRGDNFILTCKPDSHATLAERVAFWQATDGMAESAGRRWNRRFTEVTMVRYLSCITNHRLTADNVGQVAQASRGRWKIANANNNVLKTKGYHLEHNFGHGKQYLAALLLSLNLLAFLCHTVLEWSDDKYALLRRVLARRQTFFQDIQALISHPSSPSSLGPNSIRLESQN